MIKEICFDMDGTIADLYGVSNWSDYLIDEDVYPYANARPLVNMRSLARILNNKQKQGYRIKIISWLSKNGSPDYNQRVKETKEKWLKTHLKSVQWDNICIVPYGTPKGTIGNGILFDDEIQNRLNWNGQAYDVENIINVLKTLDK